MNVVRELLNNAWHQLQFAQMEIEQARTSMRNAGLAWQAPEMKRLNEASRTLTDVCKEIIHLMYPKESTNEKA